MNEYTVVPLSDVRPGDVAVCNGREFPVKESGYACKWLVEPFGCLSLTPTQCEVLGVEFRRPVPRVPRTFRRWVVLNRDKVFMLTFSEDDESLARMHAEDIEGTYFLADITEVMP